MFRETHEHAAWYGPYNSLLLGPGSHFRPCCDRVGDGCPLQGLGPWCQHHPQPRLSGERADVGSCPPGPLICGHDDHPLSFIIQVA